MNEVRCLAGNRKNVTKIIVPYIAILSTETRTFILSLTVIEFSFGLVQRIPLQILRKLDLSRILYTKLINVLFTLVTSVRIVTFINQVTVEYNL